jgi:hypothetical protein
MPVQFYCGQMFQRGLDGFNIEKGPSDGRLFQSLAHSGNLAFID